MENKKHFPMMGVGPVYGAVIIAVTAGLVVLIFLDCGGRDSCAIMIFSRKEKRKA